MSDRYPIPRHVRIAIVVGSTRPNRWAGTVAEWVHQVATCDSVAGEGVTFAVVDLSDYQLPLLDEPQPAAVGSYYRSHTRDWAEVVDSFGGFVFVMPEYNHSVPAALKNAIDYLFVEWHDKAAGFVSYGLDGGVRAVEHVRLALAEVRVACVRSQVALTLATDFDTSSTSESRVPTPRGHQEHMLQRTLHEVVAWAQALQPLRTQRAVGAARSAATGAQHEHGNLEPSSVGQGRA